MRRHTKPCTVWQSGDTLEKGWFYRLKLGLTTDLLDRMLGILLAPGNADDREMFRQINKDMQGIFVADTGHISDKLEKDFLIVENDIIKRILFAKPKKNMKKIVTAFQKFLYDTRQRIELDFRNLKMFFGLVTSLPRSVNGYFANYNLLHPCLCYVRVGGQVFHKRFLLLERRAVCLGVLWQVLKRRVVEFFNSE